MTVLVTGAFGYVGSAVMRHLAGLGSDVMTCDSGWFPDALVNDGPAPVADFRDFRSLSEDDLVGISGVIHLAAFSNDPLGALSPDLTHALNHTAAVALARKARACGVETFVFASSCSVYGPSGAEELDEFAPTNPLTAYAEAKRNAEIDLLDLATDSFRVHILRGATAFGPSDCPRTDLLLNELCAEAAMGNPITLQSDGQSWRPFMPVSDFAAALVTAAMTAPLGDGPTVWNIAPPKMQMTVIEAATRASALGELGAPRRATGSGPDKRSYRVAGERFLQAFPDFRYSEDFEGQIRDCTAFFAALPSLSKDMAETRFIRLKTLPKDLS